MKHKIGVFGSAAGDLGSALPIAKRLGKLLGRYKEKVVLVTGAGPGLPFKVVQEAVGHGVEAWGFSPAHDLAGQLSSAPEVDPKVFKRLIYLPDDLPFADNLRVARKYRNVTSTATCDAAIIISGRWGSLNEFSNLMDMQKSVGVLTGTGGIADELPGLSERITKEGQGTVIFDSDPGKLLESLIKQI